MRGRLPAAASLISKAERGCHKHAGHILRETRTTHGPPDASPRPDVLNLHSCRAVGAYSVDVMSDIDAEEPDATPEMTIDESEVDQQSGAAQAIDSVAALGRRTAGTFAAAGAATARAVGSGATATAEAGVATARTIGAGAKTAIGGATARAAHAMSAAQSLLATDLTSQLNDLVAAAVSGSASIYDKAMDANYLDPVLRPGLGGATIVSSTEATPSSGPSKQPTTHHPTTRCCKKPSALSRRCSETSQPRRDYRSPHGTRTPSTLSRDLCRRTSAYRRVGFTSSTPTTQATCLAGPSALCRRSSAGTAPVRRHSPGSPRAWRCRPPSARTRS